MSESLLRIEVAYALPEQQSIIELRLSAGTTARQAVVKSGVDAVYPEINVQLCPVGIFGATVPDDFVLRDGDRVEIYRPLINEPRAARRTAAAKGITMGSRSPND